MQLVLKLVRLLIGLVPAAVIGVWAWTILFQREAVPADIFLYAPLLAVVGGVPWFLRSQSPGHPTLQIVCAAAALLLCVVHTDWIVGTMYAYMDYPPVYQTYIPPSAPLWSPPTPQDAIPGTTSWNDDDYFSHGNAWGPTDMPSLKIHWLAVISRYWLCLLISYSVCSLFIPNRKPAKDGKI